MNSKSTNKLNIFSIAIVVVAFFSALVVAGYKSGLSDRMDYHALYSMLLPLLSFFFSLFCSFLLGKGHSPTVIKTVRAVAAALTVFFLVDGTASYVNKAVFKRKIKTDWRYKNVYHGWLKSGFSFKPDFDLKTPGPYRPGWEYELLNSAVTFDRWGFRREVKDPYPDLTEKQRRKK